MAKNSKKKNKRIIQGTKRNECYGNKTEREKNAHVCVSRCRINTHT